MAIGHLFFDSMEAMRRDGQSRTPASRWPTSRNFTNVQPQLQISEVAQVSTHTFATSAPTPADLMRLVARGPHCESPTSPPFSPRHHPHCWRIRMRLPTPDPALCRDLVAHISS